MHALKQLERVLKRGLQKVCFLGWLKDDQCSRLTEVNTRMRGPGKFVQARPDFIRPCQPWRRVWVSPEWLCGSPSFSLRQSVLDNCSHHYLSSTPGPKVPWSLCVHSISFAQYGNGIELKCLFRDLQAIQFRVILKPFCVSYTVKLERFWCNK